MIPNTTLHAYIVQVLMRSIFYIIIIITFFYGDYLILVELPFFLLNLTSPYVFLIVRL